MNSLFAILVCFSIIFTFQTASALKCYQCLSCDIGDRSQTVTCQNASDNCYVMKLGSNSICQRNILNENLYFK